MTRGIHLKRLKSNDLELLGLADPALEAQGFAPNGHTGLLAEADPVLAAVIAELRAELEGTLHLLDQALAATRKSPH